MPTVYFFKLIELHTSNICNFLNKKNYIFPRVSDSIKSKKRFGKKKTEERTFNHSDIQIGCVFVVFFFRLVPWNTAFILCRKKKTN